MFILNVTTPVLESLLCDQHSVGGLVAKLCPTLETPWTVALQAPLSMGFSRQEYWSGLPCPPPGDLSNLEIESMSLTSPALAGRFLLLTPPGKPKSAILKPASPHCWISFPFRSPQSTE